MQNNFITQEMLDVHPEYVQAGLQVGDPVPVPLTDEEMADTEDFTITQEFLDANPEFEGEVGDIIQVPKPPHNAEKVEIKVEEKVLVYQGKKVISTGKRSVNDHEVRCVRLEDGSECDISEEDYQLMLTQ